MPAALDPYHKKRNFGLTSEPRGRKGRQKGNSFVIQKHDATRLHYDFRLEMDGVLKSWAVTRGPSLDPEDKRLAVHVEDHPLDYGDFEGTIPKGEYGGGAVLLWDRGTWTPDGDAVESYAKGHMEFTLNGEKLSGRWHLVRMRGKPREKRENWLLIKGDDEAAKPADGDAILLEQPQSVKTGRLIEEIAGEAPGWSSKAGGKIPRKQKKPVQKDETASNSSSNPSPHLDPSAIASAPKAGLPDVMEPQLATLAATAPGGERYIHEIKFDGYRLLARKDGDEVTLLTRSGLDWTEKFGTALVDALKMLSVKTAMIDGEVVVETQTGASDFSALQADLSEGRADRFHFYAFDLPFLEGHDLRDKPLIERKALLETLLPPGSPVLRYSGHFDENGSDVLAHACRLGLEGVISKLKDAPYRSGRSKSWIKSKCSARQEFVIAGYVPSSVSRKAIGALVLGVFDDQKLVHVGKVGTGFSRLVAEDLLRRLYGLRVDTSPFASKLTALEAKQVRYVRPELVAEIEFRAWTGDGHLRHASYRGLREDKPASEVRRELKAEKREGGMETPKAETKNAAPVKGLTHPDRLYWPEQGVTKAGLADYYTEMWDHIAPFITNRPLALLRCPEGIHGQSFFQKHAWKGLNPAIELLKDPKNPDDQPLIGIRDLKGLVGLAQAATLEIHPWGSDNRHLEKPDMIILDLDPGEGVGWQALIDAALEVRKRLEAAGLAAFVKTSGGKGLHVVAPLKPKATWPRVKAFTKAIADSMAKDSPERYVSTITKARRKGKVFVDYLRNQRGMTAVAPYSPRARDGAAVSMPLSWEELTPGIGPAHFTILNAPTRMAALKDDPWKGFRDAAEVIPAK